VKLPKQPVERLRSVVEPLGSDIVNLHPILDPIVEGSPQITWCMPTTSRIVCQTDPLFVRRHDQPSHGTSAATFSAASRCSPYRGEYVSRVITTELCPSRSHTTFTCTAGLGATGCRATAT
jgi:hypothetical protein